MHTVITSSIIPEDAPKPGCADAVYARPGPKGSPDPLDFAGIMNFVIFPMFFASSALYPLWRVKESSLLLYRICTLNAFTFATELIRFAFYAKPEPVSLAVVLACTAVFMAGAISAYDPARGLIALRGGPGGRA